MSQTEMIAAEFGRLLRDQLVSLEGAKKQGPVRRASVVYSTDSLSDSIYFVDTGYVKIVKKGADGKEVLLSIVGPGQIFGEQAINFNGNRSSAAEVLQDGVLYEIPRASILEFFRTHPEGWQLLSEVLLARARDAEQKIGMLCLNDVETRILHYLGSLIPVFGVEAVDGQPYTLPLSQSELASLIGATRETTSTTLNALARKGVLKLGRRMLTVTSPDTLRVAMNDRAVGAQG